MTNSTTDKPAAAKRPRKMAREPKLQNVDELQNGKAPVVAPTVPTIGSAPAASRAPTKVNLILDLLSRPQGATLDAMVEATGWLPHTTRAALTGLKKKGHEVTSIKAAGVRTYQAIKPQSEPAKVTDETGAKSEA